MNKKQQPMNKYRINQDLEGWIGALKEIKEVLDTAGVRYWLDMGTLLGVIRDGKLIDYDTDIDLSTKVAEAPKVLQLIPQFAKMGYRVDVTDTSIYLTKGKGIVISIAFYVSEGDKIWVLFLLNYPKFDKILKRFRRVAECTIYQEYHRGLTTLEGSLYAIIPRFLRWFVRRSFFKLCAIFGEEHFPMVLPKRFIDNLGTIDFRGMKFNIPNPPEEYLPLVYGPSWRSPTADWKWADVEAIDRNFFKNRDRAQVSLFTRYE